MKIVKLSLHTLIFLSSIYSTTVLPHMHVTQHPVSYSPKGPTHDALICATYSMSFLGLNFLTTDPIIKKFLAFTAINMPIFRFLSTHKTYTIMLKYIPILGKHFACHNPSCTSICNKCKVKHVFKETVIRTGYGILAASIS